MPRFAANLSMMFQEIGFLDRFAAAKKAGFRGVEFLFPYEFDATDLAGRLKESGLEQVLFNAPPGDWAAGERGLACLPGREAEFHEGVARALAYARTLECPRLHVMAGIAPEGIVRERLRETYVENLRTAAAEAAKMDMTVLIEPLNPRDMPGYFLNRTDQALEILGAAGAANLKLQLDLYHRQVAEGDLAGTLERVREHIGHIQIADTPGRHEPGSGEINYPFLFALIDRLGYAGWIGCEYQPAGRTEDGLGWAAPHLGRD